MDVFYFCLAFIETLPPGTAATDFCHQQGGSDGADLQQKGGAPGADPLLRSTVRKHTSYRGEKHQGGFSQSSLLLVAFIRPFCVQ